MKEATGTRVKVLTKEDLKTREPRMTLAAQETNIVVREAQGLAGIPTTMAADNQIPWEPITAVAQINMGKTRVTPGEKTKTMASSITGKEIASSGKVVTRTEETKTSVQETLVNTRAAIPGTNRQVQETKAARVDIYMDKLLTGIRAMVLSGLMSAAISKTSRISSGILRPGLIKIRAIGETRICLVAMAKALALVEQELLHLVPTSLGIKANIQTITPIMTKTGFHKTEATRIIAKTGATEMKAMEATAQDMILIPEAVAAIETATLEAA